MLWELNTDAKIEMLIANINLLNERIIRMEQGGQKLYRQLETHWEMIQRQRDLLESAYDRIKTLEEHLDRPDRDQWTEVYHP